MKSIPLFAAVVLSICFAISVHSEEIPGGPANVELDLLVVEIPEAVAVPMLPRLRGSKSSGEAREEVLKLIASHGAKLLGWPLLQTKSGQRAVVEQIDELRYATEFEAPGTAKITETTEPAPSLAVDAPPPKAPAPVKVTKAETISDGIPTAFETRNVGVTLEVEPVIDADGKTVHLNLNVQDVRLRGFRKVEIEQKGSGKSVVVEQPEIAANKVTTSLSVQDGDTTLLGVFKVEEPVDHLELFILQTRIKRLGQGDKVPGKQGR